jgi:hypothetical protein
VIQERETEQHSSFWEPDILEIDQGLTSRAACERIERASDTAQKPDVSP